MTPSSPPGTSTTTTSSGGGDAGKSGRTTSGTPPLLVPSPVVNYVAIAREITAQPWADVGLPLSSRASGTAATTHHRPGTENDETATPTTNGDEGASRAAIVDRLVALLVVRIVALVGSRRRQQQEEQPVLDRARSAPACVGQGANAATTPLVNNCHNYGTGTTTGEGSSHHPNAAASSTTTWTTLDFDGACPTSDELPAEITPAVLDQLHSFVSHIASNYRDVRYHSLEHGYHVTACANCLLDMLLRAGGEEDDGDDDDIDEEDEEEGADDDHEANTRRRRHRQQLQNFAATTTNEEEDNEAGGQHNRSPTAASNPRPSGRRGSRRCSTNTASSAAGIPSPDAYGLRNDPVAQLALIFSAVIHDVDHRGITNQQLVREADELAIMYNDQSVAEQRSISLAFYELMRKRPPPPREASDHDDAPPEYVYGALRAVLFGEDGHGVGGDGADDPPSPPAATTDGEDYVRFRRMVIDMVLSTDIASPERIQVGKSKYRAAFGPKRRGSHASSQMQQHGGHGGHGGQHHRHHQQGQGPASPKGPSPARTAASSSYSSQQGMATSPPADEASTVDAVAAAAEEEVMNIRRKESLDDDEEADLGASDPERKCSLREEFLNHRGSLNMSQLSSFRRLSNVSSTTTSSESSDFRPQCQPPAVTENARRRSRSPTGSASDDDDPKAATRDLRNHLPGSREGSRRGGLGSKQSSSRRGVLSTSSAREDSFRRRKGGGLASDTHQRRFSAPAVSYPTREYRLGIRRALNLTGSTVSLFNSTTGAKPGRDEEDELRANVVLELIIKAADIAPIMQGWENYNRWSRALFFEQKVAHEARRGPDPAPGWFDNQITFFDSYGMPLAKRLADVQVFGTRRSVQFARNILENRRRWLVEGRSRLADLILDWEEMKRRREASDGGEEAGASSLSALHDFCSERN